MNAPAVTAAKKEAITDDQLQALLAREEALFTAIGLLIKRNGALQRNMNTGISSDDILAFYKWYSGPEKVPTCHPGVLKLLRLWKARLTSLAGNARIADMTRGSIKITRDVLDGWIRASESAPPPCTLDDKATEAPTVSTATANFNASAIVAPILEKLNTLEKRGSVIAPAATSLASSAASVQSAEDLETVLEALKTSLKDKPDLSKEVEKALQQLKEPIDASLKALQDKLAEVLAASAAEKSAADNPALQTQIQAVLDTVKATTSVETLAEQIRALKADLGRDHAELFERLQRRIQEKCGNGTAVGDAGATVALKEQLQELHSDVIDIKQDLKAQTQQQLLREILERLQELQKQSSLVQLSSTSNASVANTALKAAADAIQNEMNEASDMSEDYSKTLRKLYALQTELEEWQKARQQNAQRMRNATAQSEAYKKQIAELESQIEQKAIALQSLQSQPSPTKNQTIQSLEQDVRAKNATIVQLENELAELKLDLSDLRNAADEARAQDQQVEQVKRALGEEKELLASVTQDLQSAKETNEVVKRLHAECLDRQKQLERDLASMEAATLKQVEDARAERNAFYAKQVAELQTRIQDHRPAQLELETCKKDLEMKQAELDACKKDLEATETELTATKQELENCKKEQSSDTEFVRALKQDAESTHRDLTSTENKLAETSRTLETTRGELTTAQTRLKNRDAYYRRIHPALSSYGIETFSDTKDYTRTSLEESQAEIFQAVPSTRFGIAPSYGRTVSDKAKSATQQSLLKRSAAVTKATRKASSGISYHRTRKNRRSTR